MAPESAGGRIPLHSLALILLLLLPTILVPAHTSTPRALPESRVTAQHYDNTSVTVRDSGKHGNLLVITNARGRYAIYPGFIPLILPQAKIETHRIMIKWGNEIADAYIDNNLGDYVNKMHTYYFIVTHPNYNPKTYRNLVQNYIFAFSSNKSTIVFVGHSGPRTLELYHWDTLFSTPSYHLLPPDSPWTNQETLDVTLNITGVRKTISQFYDEINTSVLPRMIFLISCSNLYGDNNNLNNNWAYAFYFNYSDYYQGLWNNRILVGFDAPLQYNLATGDHKAAKLVKIMLENLGTGMKTHKAFINSAKKTGFHYIICNTPYNCITGSGREGEKANAVLLGSDFTYDPSPEEIAINTFKAFLSSIGINESRIKLFIDNLKIEKEDIYKYDDLLFYDIESDIVERYPKEPRIRNIASISATVMVDGMHGEITSFIVSGTYYSDGNASAVDWKVLKESTRWIFRKYIGDFWKVVAYAKQDINVTRAKLLEHGIKLEFIRYSAKNLTDALNARYLPYIEIGGKKWYLYYGRLGLLDYDIRQPNIYIMYDYNDSEVLYDNSLKFMLKMIDNTNLNVSIKVNDSVARKIIFSKLSKGKYKISDVDIERILLFDNKTGDVTPFYYATIIINMTSSATGDCLGDQAMIVVFVNAVNGKTRVYYYGVAGTAPLSSAIEWYYAEYKRYIAGLALAALALVAVIVYKTHRKRVAL